MNISSQYRIFKFKKPLRNNYVVHRQLIYGTVGTQRNNKTSKNITQPLPGRAQRGLINRVPALAECMIGNVQNQTQAIPVAMRS